MEREVVKNNNIHHRRESLGRAHNETTNSPATASADFVLQWGNRKRLRCMKIQVKDDSPGDGKSTGDAKTGSLRVDRRVVRANKDLYSTTTSTNNFNLRRLPSSSPPPPPLPPAHRILRNSEIPSSMKGQINGVKNSSFSPERGEEKKSNNNNFVNGGSVSSETAHDSKKGGSSSGSEAIPVWPPKFVIALTNKEKEEDFMAIKGSKLPQRPKKRAKIIQRTVNLVSPGSWLCDLTLERYQVREKKISKKRPRGLKAMGNIDSDSE